MKQKIGILTLTLLFLAGMPQLGWGCVVRRISEVTAHERANLIVVATMVGSGSRVDYSWGRTQDFVIRVDEVVRGSAKIGERMQASLTNLRARVDEHGTLHCFEQHGSGNEEHYRPGERHLWLLSKGQDQVRILWSDPSE